MMTPMMGNRLPPDRVWAADTGCFAAPHKHDDDKYLAWLDRWSRNECIFVTAPDVVGDAKRTLERAAPMLPRIREAGYPAALVGQDGMVPSMVPWDEVDAIFLGGSTAWKLGEDAVALVAEAKAREKWAHMGRVNSLHRLRIAKRMGCDSCDGTYIAFGPDQLSPRVARWVRTVGPQLTLPLERAV